MSHSDKSDVTTTNWGKQLEGLTAVMSFHLTECICLFIIHICRMQGPHRVENVKYFSVIQWKNP